MSNPWKDIDLQVYEAHMQLDSVRQLQVLDAVMEQQFSLCKGTQVMILGIAGGNGLRHVKSHAFQTVYGVDVNGAYLKECQMRYPALKNIFNPIEADLLDEHTQLPKCDLLLANLLVEYIGYARFQELVRQSGADIISIVIQLDSDEGFISNSPYLHTFDALDIIHEQIREAALTNTMKEIDYVLTGRCAYPLPNEKLLLQLDYEKANK